MQLVDGVKELFLGAFLVTDNLDIVDEEDIGGAVAGAELMHTLQAKSPGHHFVGKPLPPKYR